MLSAMLKHWKIDFRTKFWFLFAVYEPCAWAQQFIGYDDGSSPHFSGAKVLPAISIMFIQFLRLGNLIFPFSTVKPPSTLSSEYDE